MSRLGSQNSDRIWATCVVVCLFAVLGAMAITDHRPWLGGALLLWSVLLSAFLA